MTQEQTPFQYRISGLILAADLELPSAVPIPACNDKADLTIIAGQIPPAPEHDMAQAERDRADGIFRLRVPNVGRFVITKTRIQYEEAATAVKGDLALHLVGTCLAVVLQQRGGLVLHASAVNVYGRAMLFLGPSGTGKSTLAAMLALRGFPVLTDDVAYLVAETGRFAVHPDGRMLKLWNSTKEQLDQQGDYTRIRDGQDKFYVPPANSDVLERPAGGLFFVRDEGSHRPNLSRLSTADAIRELHANVFRPTLIAAMGQQAACFKACAALCTQAEMWVLDRPRNFDVAEEVLDLLTDHWRKQLAEDSHRE